MEQRTQSLPPAVTSRAPGSEPLGDEIDLVELLGFLLRIKWWLVGGLAAGLALGLAATLFLGKPRYVSRLSVTVDPASLPAITDSKKVADTFTAALGSPDLATTAFRRLLEAAPELSKNLQAREVGVPELVAAQTSTITADAAPMRVTSLLSSQDFQLEAAFPVKGLGPDAARAILTSVNEMAAEHNQRAVNMHQESSKNLVRLATKAVQEAESSSTQVQTQHESELMRIRTELARVEFRLMRHAVNSKALQLFLQTFSKPGSLQFVSQNREGRLQVDSSESDLDIDRVLRLVAGLEEEKSITAQEAAAHRKTLVDLQLSYLKNESLYSSVLQANKAVMVSLYDSMSKAVVPVDRALTFLPSFRMNEQLYTDDVARKAFEVRQRGRNLLAVAAAGVGLVAGGLLGAGLEFFRKNRRKLEELSKAPG